MNTQKDLNCNEEPPYTMDEIIYEAETCILGGYGINDYQTFLDFMEICPKSNASDLSEKDYVHIIEKLDCDRIKSLKSTPSEQKNLTSRGITACLESIKSEVEEYLDTTNTAPKSYKGFITYSSKHIINAEELTEEMYLQICKDCEICVGCKVWVRVYKSGVSSINPLNLPREEFEWMKQEIIFITSRGRYILTNKGWHESRNIYKVWNSEC